MTVAFDPDWIRPAAPGAGAGLMEDEGIFYYVMRRPTTVQRALREADPSLRSLPSASLLLADALGASHVVTIAAPRTVPTRAAGLAFLEARSSRDGRRHLLRFARGNGDRAVITAIQPI